MSKAWKIGLSVWIAFHLMVICSMPNSGSFLGRHMPLTMIDYANILGLNSTWNFFSPDPAQTMYLSYKVHFEDADGNDNRDPVEGFLPPEKNEIVIDSSRRRLLYAMRFLLLETKRIETVFAPWLCRQYPGASEVSVSYIQETIPTLDVAVSELRTSIPELLKTMQSDPQHYRCDRPADEESP